MPMHAEPNTPPHPSPGTTPGATGSPAPYFTHTRRDVLAMIPEEARDILSVGCGGDFTEAALILRGCRVVGLERDHDAAEQARRNRLEVIEGDATETARALQGRWFDCLIYADVLEHIMDPVSVLMSHIPHLRPGGCVVISVPNFRHYRVLRDLFLRGVIRYTDAGILDRTHVRLTTRRMVEDWFVEVGLVRDRLHLVMGRRQHAFRIASLGLLREFLASQVILRGVRQA